VLGLRRGEYCKAASPGLHLYQELCPVTPRVAAKLPPDEFATYITDRRQPVSVEKIVFTELSIDGLAEDPDGGNVSDLPYANLDHLRDCNRYAKPTKVVARDSAGLLYRTIVGGFYVADSTGMLYYPMPTSDELETRYYAWWRSARSTFVI
jgi:hypothetical protein